MCRNYDKGECAEPGCTGRVSCQDFTDGRCVEHSYNGRGGWSDDEDEDAAEGSTGAPLPCEVHLSKSGTWVCMRCGYVPKAGDSATWQFVSVIPAREADADV